MTRGSQLGGGGPATPAGHLATCGGATQQQGTVGGGVAFSGWSSLQRKGQPLTVKKHPSQMPTALPVSNRRSGLTAPD